MPLSALALVLLAAVLHASWNIVAKRAGGDQRFSLITSLLTSVLWLPAGCGSAGMKGRLHGRRRDGAGQGMRRW